MSKKQTTALLMSLYNLPADDAPIKKTWVTNLSKTHIESWTVSFNNAKNISVVFATAYAKIPLVQLTLASTWTIPAYKTNVSTTWFSIKFQTVLTIDVDWIATERP